MDRAWVCPMLLLYQGTSLTSFLSIVNSEALAYVYIGSVPHHHNINIIPEYWM